MPWLKVMKADVLALRTYATRRGFMPAGEYVDYASGTRDDRPQYQALLAAARKRHIDVVLVWRYDRFARSTQALVQALNEFHSLGVDFISYYRLRVFRIANTVRLGRGVGQERWGRVGASEKYVAR